jgi:5-methylcytosine-specific restriction endonuclease McrA
MKPSFLILIITALLAYNTYYDNFIIKTFTTYQKYYKIAGIVVLGIGFYIMVQRNPKESINTMNALNQYINVMPIDKHSKDLITPFLNYNTKEERSTNRLLQNSRTHKRSVSETKKKFVASNQNWCCGDCKEKLPAWFEVDHKKRLDQGGSNDINNLVALCRNCHGKKTSLENI